MRPSIAIPGLTAAVLLAATPVQARITFDLDYSLDANNFFDSSTANGLAARAAFEVAADTFSDRFLDQLTAITPGGVNQFTAVYTDPSNGAEVTSSFGVPANTQKVFAGGFNLPGSTLGTAGPGGFGVEGTQAFVDGVVARGQPGALSTPETDFGPWGGSAFFDNATNWNFNVAAGPSTGQSDFLSVALHELAHLVGFGTAPSFDTNRSGLVFTGPKATAQHGNTVTLANTGHLSALNSTVNGTTTQQVALSPSITTGTRKLMTLLDWAVLDDIGWDLARPGDANASGGVDFDDLLLLAQNYGGSDKSWSEADFNYDRTVNFDDLLALAKNYNTTGPLPAALAEAGGADFAADWALAQALVPEPATIATLGMGAFALVGRRRRA